MKRYFKPSNGKSVASKEAMAMFDDKEKRTAIVYSGGGMCGAAAVAVC